MYQDYNSGQTKNLPLWLRAAQKLLIRLRGSILYFRRPSFWLWMLLYGRFLCAEQRQQLLYCDERTSKGYGHYLTGFGALEFAVQKILISIPGN